MQIWGITPEQATEAADRARVRAYLPAWSGPKRRSIRVRLKTSGPTSDGRPTVYGRRGYHVNANGKRRRVPGAVCWHGHRAFMLALFELNPEARVKSNLADYRGRAHFERTHGATFFRGVDYMGYDMPGAAKLPCDCPATANPPDRARAIDRASVNRDGR